MIGWWSDTSNKQQQPQISIIKIQRKQREIFATKKKNLEKDASQKYRDVSGLSLVMWNYLHFSFRLDLMKNITLEKVLCIFKFGGAST